MGIKCTAEPDIMTPSLQVGLTSLLLPAMWRWGGVNIFISFVSPCNSSNAFQTVRSLMPNRFVTLYYLISQKSFSLHACVDLQLLFLLFQHLWYKQHFRQNLQQFSHAKLGHLTRRFGCSVFCGKEELLLVLTFNFQDILHEQQPKSNTTRKSIIGVL